MIYAEIPIYQAPIHGNNQACLNKLCKKSANFSFSVFPGLTQDSLDLSS